MDQVQKSLKALWKKLEALPPAVRLAVIGGAAAVCAVLVTLSLSTGGEQYQYAFTNLSSEDSAEAAAALKTAGVPFRLDASGAALAVPANKVYDARLLLAASGLPRGGGVGFELFDRGDIGLSEFTQKVNLRRATEGELARTIGRLAAVRSARVHLTMSEKGLYRDEDKKASAAVVVNLQQGRTLGEKELAGIRHLISSAVPGLGLDQVTIVDGKGTVLAADSGPGHAAAAQERELERDLEARIVAILEPAVGAGAVVAKVTASLDASEVQTQAEVFDPEATALRSERKVTSTQQQESGAALNGVAGAAANQPLPPVPAANSATAPGSRGTGSSDDQVRNFEVSKTTTTTVARGPRLKRLSAAVLLDGVGGKARTEAEVARLGELAKRAVGFDPARGDVLEISSSVFAHAEDAPAPAAALPSPWQQPKTLALLGGGALLAVLGLAFVLRGNKRTGAEVTALTLRPGSRVAEIEASLAAAAGELPPPAPVANPQLPDPSLVTRDRARELARQDPARAAHLLKAWILADGEPQEAK